VFTYCGAYSPHDQYFLQRKHEMVQGSVGAPRLELANEALIRAHVQAECLTEVGLMLRSSIGEVADKEAAPDFPLHAEVKERLHLSEARLAQLRTRLAGMFFAGEVTGGWLRGAGDGQAGRGGGGLPRQGRCALDQPSQVVRG